MIDNTTSTGRIPKLRKPPRQRPAAMPDTAMAAAFQRAHQQVCESCDKQGDVCETYAQGAGCKKWTEAQ